MQGPDRFVSPAQLSRALGLGESTIKRWIDQGRVPAEKTPGGHRRVRLSDALRLLRCGTADAPDARVLGFQPADEASPETLASFLCSDCPEHAVELLESLYASGVATGELSDRWIAPAMQRIGHDWETGRLGVAGEHCATATMLRALHALLRAQPAVRTGAPRAFVAGLSQDPYLLAPLCAQLVLSEAGFATTNFGPDTPSDCLMMAVREQRPAIVALSFSVAESTGARVRAALGATCQAAGSALVVGGRGLRPDLVDALGATVWCRSMTELDRMARHLAAKSAAQDVARAG